jgi:hypothetical protein
MTARRLPPGLPVRVWALPSFAWWLMSVYAIALGDGGGGGGGCGGSLDFLAFWALSMLLACTIDRVNGAAGGGSCSSACWALTLLPLLGSIAWLMGRQRPPTTQASAAPSHSKAKAS